MQRSKCHKCGQEDVIYVTEHGQTTIKEKIYWTNYFGNQEELVDHKCHLGIKAKFKEIKNVT
jgi:hypothetical protein